MSEKATNIYTGITGKAAIDFLILKKEGEVKGAFFHEKIGNIDLVWGKGGEKGYGLAKILEKHPEAIPNLAQSIAKGKIVEHLNNRVIIINAFNQQRSIVDLQFNDTLKSWVVTSYIPLEWLQPTLEN